MIVANTLFMKTGSGMRGNRKMDLRVGKMLLRGGLLGEVEAVKNISGDD